MSRQLKKADCWKKPRIRLGEGLIEVSEKRRVATFFVALFVVLMLGLFGLVLLGMLLDGQFDLGGLMVVGIVMAIPVVMLLAIYRPPRVLRLFPDERLAQRYHRFIGFKFKHQWYDLSEAAINIELRQGKGDAQLTGFGAALGCLLMFAGPLSLLVSLLGPKKYETLSLYCLTHASAGRRPIAVFANRSTPARLADLYQSLEQQS